MVNLIHPKDSVVRGVRMLSRRQSLVPSTAGRSAIVFILMPLLASALLGVGGMSAVAQTYPTVKPIRLLVGFAPGGANDTVARVLGAKLSQVLGQQIVIDNRPGASGIIANSIAAGAAADGYTVLIVPASFSFDESLRAKLPYDPRRHFTPVSLVATAPLIFLTHNSFPARNIQELLILAKARPGKLNYAHGGNGNITHLIMELLKSLAGVDITPIAYKGAGPGLIALMSGEVEVQSTAILSAMAQLKAGKIRALAVTSAKRSPILPEVPAVAESGLPGYEASGWWGVLAPGGTPSALVKVLNEAILRALHSTDVREKFTQLGTEVIGSSPEEFSMHIRKETVKWSKVVSDSGIRVE